MIEDIKVIPPTPGACKLCAARHRPEEPHDRDSLYYQNYFYMRYRRFPTWDDAMSHCTEDMKRAFRAELERRGKI